jgi:transcriptional regulator with XRE-family HTH domain
MTHKGKPKTTPERLEFGNRLEHTRLARKLTVAELSRQTGLSGNAIHNYESGIRMPKVAGPDSDASWLCKILGIEMNWLLRGDPQHLTQAAIKTLYDYGWDVLDDGAPPPLKKGRGARSKAKRS